MMDNMYEFPEPINDNPWKKYYIQGVRVKAKLRASGLMYDVCLPDCTIVPMLVEPFHEIAEEAEDGNRTR